MNRILRKVAGVALMAIPIALAVYFAAPDGFLVVAILASLAFTSGLVAIVIGWYLFNKD
jgi:hypothetical protein